jgi:hypothetical protein
VIAAARQLEAAIHIISGGVVVCSTRSGDAKFGQGIPDDGCYGGVVRLLDGADGDHEIAKVAILAQHGDHAVQDRDGEDEDADKRPVSVFHSFLSFS